MNNDIAALVNKPKADLLPEEFAILRNHYLSQWESAKSALDAAKGAEAEFRRKAVDFLRGPDDKAGKTLNVPLANNFAAKFKIPENYGWIKGEDGKDDVDSINGVLDKIESMGEAGKLIAERIVKWKPELSKSEYNLLNGEFKELMDKIIVVSEGTPTLEIVEVKRGAKK